MHNQAGQEQGGTGQAKTPNGRGDDYYYPLPIIYGVGQYKTRVIDSSRLNNNDFMKTDGLKPEKFVNSVNVVDMCIYKRQQIPCSLYVIQCGDTDFYKIGIAGNVGERVSGLQLGCPFTLSVVLSTDMPDRADALKIESLLHKIFDSSSVHREWFNLDKESFIELSGFFPSTWGKELTNFIKERTG